MPHVSYPAPDERPSTPQPWEQQEGESNQAYEAFAAYRDFGPGRSIAKVTPTVNKNIRLLERWSSVHHWQDRVRAYDANLDRARIDAALSTWAEAAELAAAKTLAALRALDAENMGASNLPHLLRESSKLALLLGGKATERRDEDVKAQVEVTHDAADDQLAAIFRALTGSERPTGPDPVSLATGDDEPAGAGA